MTEAVLVGLGTVAIVVAVVETLRWTLRPAAKRLRVIRKLGSRR